MRFVISSSARSGSAGIILQVDIKDFRARMVVMAQFFAEEPQKRHISKKVPGAMHQGDYCHFLDKDTPDN